MSESSKVGRRGFLKYVGAGAVTIGGAAAAYYLYNTGPGREPAAISRSTGTITTTSTSAGATAASYSNTSSAIASTSSIASTTAYNDVEKCLQEIAEVNPRLAEELKRLPEVQDNEVDLQALRRVTQLALSDDSQTRNNLQVMMNEGITGRRKYCAHLQALLWYCETSDPIKSNVLQSRALLSFVELAWAPTYKTYRWTDFGRVVERLSSPELVSIYMRHNIRYQSEQLNEYVPAKVIFERGYDDCDGHATLQAYFLRANGYDAWNVGLSIETSIGHGVCGYVINGKYHVLDVAGKKVGPFKSWIEVSDYYANKRMAVKGGSIVLIDPFDITFTSSSGFNYKHKRIR